MRVDGELLAQLMQLADVRSPQLARATCVSPGYVRQLKCGLRQRVRREFLLRAGDYLGRILGETGRLATALIQGE